MLWEGVVTLREEEARPPQGAELDAAPPTGGASQFPPAGDPSRRNQGWFRAILLISPQFLNSTVNIKHDYTIMLFFSALCLFPFEESIICLL
jgi:hypothetical protein